MNNQKQNIDPSQYNDNENCNKQADMLNERVGTIKRQNIQSSPINDSQNKQCQSHNSTLLAQCSQSGDAQQLIYGYKCVIKDLLSKSNILVCEVESLTRQNEGLLENNQTLVLQLQLANSSLSDLEKDFQKKEYLYTDQISDLDFQKQVLEKQNQDLQKDFTTLNFNFTDLKNQYIQLEQEFKDRSSNELKSQMKEASDLYLNQIGMLREEISVLQRTQQKQQTELGSFQFQTQQQNLEKEKQYREKIQAVQRQNDTLIDKVAEYQIQIRQFSQTGENQIGYKNNDSSIKKQISKKFSNRSSISPQRIHVESFQDYDDQIQQNFQFNSENYKQKAASAMQINNIKDTFNKTKQQIQANKLNAIKFS